MEYRLRLMLALAVVSTCALSASRSYAQSGEVRAAVEAGNKEWVAAFTRRDSSAIADLYTTTAEVFPPQSEIVRGREAIARFWQGAMDAGIKEAAVTTLEVESSGDVAHEVGTYTLTGDAGKVLDAGKYVVVWKKEDGRWKLHRDIWNTNLPPPKP